MGAFSLPSSCLDHLLLLCLEGSEIHRKGKTAVLKDKKIMNNAMVIIFVYQIINLGFRGNNIHLLIFLQLRFCELGCWSVHQIFSFSEKSIFVH